MVSVIRLDSDEVQKWCDAGNQDVDEDNKVQIASYLCPGNYAVSGGVKGVEAVEAKAKPFKDRMTMRLAAAGAFHTSLMEPAVSRLEAALAATEIRRPRIPVVSIVDAQPHADDQEDLGDFSCSMGNNSDDSPSQRAEEELRIRTWKGSSSSKPLKLQNQSHLAVIYTLGASYLAEFIPSNFIRLLLALSREWTRKQKQRIVAPEMAQGLHSCEWQLYLACLDIAAQRSLPCLPKCRKTLPCAGKFFPYSSVSGMVSWYLLMGAAKPGEFGSENFRWCLH
ncbi:hypothetical protein OIU76_020232 [Salix suchowensis]|nr:hypothetical protein OIU76_020232 [Salix suchowensis]